MLNYNIKIDKTSNTRIIGDIHIIYKSINENEDKIIVFKCISKHNLNSGDKIQISDYRVINNSEYNFIPNESYVVTKIDDLSFYILNDKDLKLIYFDLNKIDNNSILCRLEDTSYYPIDNDTLYIKYLDKKLPFTFIYSNNQVEVEYVCKIELEQDRSEFYIKDIQYSGTTFNEDDLDYALNAGQIELYVIDNRIINNKEFLIITTEKPLFNLNIPLTEDFDLNTLRKEEQNYNDIPINEIIDYEKIRFSPTSISNGKITNKIVEKIIFNLNFLKDNTWVDNCSSLFDIGFTDTDILYQKERLKKSFIRISFYDNIIPANQNLLAYNTIFFNTKDFFMKMTRGINSENNSSLSIDKYGKYTNSIRSQFIVENPLINTQVSSDGYYLYFFKDYLDLNSGSTVYMKIEFNNAATGIMSIFTKNKEKIKLNGYYNYLYTPIKIIYDREMDKYLYYIDLIGENETDNDGVITYNLYEINVE